MVSPEATVYHAHEALVALLRAGRARGIIAATMRISSAKFTTFQIGPRRRTCGRRLTNCQRRRTRSRPRISGADWDARLAPLSRARGRGWGWGLPCLASICGVMIG